MLGGGGGGSDAQHARAPRCACALLRCRCCCCTCPHNSAPPLIHTHAHTVSNFRTEDWKLVGAASAAGYPIGYAIGFRYHLPRPSGKFGVFMCGTAALAHATQRVAARLLGVLENDAEVKAYGIERKGK